MEIEFYERMRGDYPVNKFIKDLPSSHQKKIYKRIERLIKYGLQHSLRTKIVKKFKEGNHNGLYDLIISYDGMFYRILFVIIKDTYWFISAFKKKSNKTPAHELDKAMEIKKQLEKQYGF